LLYEQLKYKQLAFIEQLSFEAFGLGNGPTDLSRGNAHGDAGNSVYRLTNSVTLTLRKGIINMEKIHNTFQLALARQDDLVIQNLSDEVMVYDLNHHKAHCLNKTAAFVWQHCDGETSVDELARLLRRETGSPADEEVIWYALDKLGQANLLAERLTPPTKDGMSRRRMIRRLGALMMMPAVVSIVAPTAVHAQTVIVAPFKIADGSCDSPPGPLPPSRCLLGETCCTGTGRICLPVPGSPGTSDCIGNPCVPAGSASDC
jgi:Coenzyme PQQ synthesis protein D (PqqD)